jgi:hypothetical protein
MTSWEIGGVFQEWIDDAEVVPALGTQQARCKGGVVSVSVPPPPADYVSGCSDDGSSGIDMKRSAASLV